MVVVKNWNQAVGRYGKRNVVAWCGESPLLALIERLSSDLTNSSLWNHLSPLRTKYDRLGRERTFRKSSPVIRYYCRGSHDQHLLPETTLDTSPTTYVGGVPGYSVFDNLWFNDGHFRTHDV
jgi:hypothetical protein